ncbi:hypothetical protein Tsp_05878, partial [Trichinella spiralis]
YFFYLKIHCSIFHFCYVIKGQNFDLTFNILIDMNNEEKKKRKHGRFVEEADRGRHETDHRRHEAEQEKTKGICGSPWVPIL